jgi:hypothetical protein
LHSDLSKNSQFKKFVPLSSEPAAEPLAFSFVRRAENLKLFQPFP